MDPFYPKCDRTIRRIIDPALFLESQKSNFITDTEMLNKERKALSRELSCSGLRGQVTVSKPLFRRGDNVKRLTWAKITENLIAYDAKFLFSDESRLEVCGSNRRVYVRRQRVERMMPQCANYSARNFCTIRVLQM